MNSIKKLWFRPVDLDEGERVLWSASAVRQQDWHAVAGELSLTSERLIFTAIRLETLVKGRDWSARREDIVSTGMIGRNLEGGPFTGGMSRRLQIELLDGTRERFVVDDLKGVSQRIQELLAS